MNHMVRNPQRMHGTLIVLAGGYLMTYFTESHITIIIYKHALTRVSRHTIRQGPFKYLYIRLT